MSWKSSNPYILTGVKQLRRISLVFPVLIPFFNGGNPVNAIVSFVLDFADSQPLDSSR